LPDVHAKPSVLDLAIASPNSPIYAISTLRSKIKGG
jgi:hypothetical protein